MAEHLDALLALGDPVEQKHYADTCIGTPSDELVDALKEEATQVLRADVQRSLQLAGLILHLAAHNGHPCHRALGLLAQANALSLGGLGEYERALDLYNAAADIYVELEMPVEAANAQIAKILALANLGRYAEALDAGEWAADVLESHAEWLRLAKLTTNLGFIQYRMGEDARALAHFDRARDSYRSLGSAGEARKATARLENNRSIVLRNLGQFDASIQTSQSALDLLEASHQPAETARAKQNLAITYFMLGRYNEALALLEEARSFFVADGRSRDAVLVELFMSDCLLDLGRYADVLEKTERVRSLFTEQGSSFEVGQAALNEATAYAGMGRYEQSLDALAEARAIFAGEGNATWIASTDLETAVVLYRLGRYDESRITAQAAEEIFRDHNLPVDGAQAALATARAAAALHQDGAARDWIATALDVGQSHELPSLLYLCHHLLGELAEAQSDPQEALEQYMAAVDQVERLRHRLMVEFRIDFLEDKQTLYEDVVAMCLASDQPQRALDYAERAKSRVLRELLDYRLELGLRARNPEERALVDELQRLKAERDQLYRRWEGDRDVVVRGWSPPGGVQRQIQHEVLVLEKRMTELWHKLLIRNADYAADAMLWQTRTEPVQPYLAPDTLLLEYFVARKQMLLFAVTAKNLHVYRLSAPLDRIQQAMRLLQLNFGHVVGSATERVAGLSANAEGLLQQLYGYLLEPLVCEGSDTAAAASSFAKWIVVPHGPLHYLPFHALHDGATYLAQRHEISYLPGASLLRHLTTSRHAAAGERALVLGHSYGGALPHTLDEAQTVAGLLNGDLYLEEAAALKPILEQGAQAPVLHFATHGDFRPDNPLFSGIALAGGWLTTLDIFSLRLRASLVTLSACQTGRNVIGGGDELLGLARAFLSAGASSLLLSLWPVEDRSTALFMDRFYRQLTAGRSKGAALREAQSHFIGADLDDPAATRLVHPYYWAPFALIGDTGQL